MSVMFGLIFIFVLIMIVVIAGIVIALVIGRNSKSKKLRSKGQVCDECGVPLAVDNKYCDKCGKEM